MQYPSHRFYYTFIFVLSLILSGSVWGQPPRSGERPAIGKLTGRIVVAGTEKPLEYATLTLTSTFDSNLVTGGIANADGFISIEKIPVGRYRATVSFIGCKKRVLDDLRFLPRNPEVNLGLLYLEPATLDLNAVTVTGEKKAIEYNLDKKIVTVDNNLTTMGGTATDVLQTIPSVTVDIDGTVSLRGSSNVTMLIDGRPSQIISLDEIPASMIDRVEIVTNPSARYDPDGTSGIINIVLKKKRSPGYNGMLLLNAGTGDKYNGSVNFNYRVNRLNLFVTYDNRLGRMTGWTRQEREALRNDTTYYLNQNRDNSRRMQFNNLRFGGDWFINNQNTLSLSALVNGRSHKSSEFTNYINRDYLYEIINGYNRNVKGASADHGYELALNYKRTYDQSSKEWTSDLFFSTEKENDDLATVQVNTDSVLTILPSAPFLQNTYSDNRNRLLTLQTDYVQPLGTTNRLEAGYKSTFRYNDADYELVNYDHNQSVWISDTTATNRFITDEQIHSAYGVLSSILGRLQVQAGLRLELASNLANQVTAQEKNRYSYFSLFPTVHLRYNLTESQGLQTSYSRRVNRPRGRQLNPFINYSDPTNISFGNPRLKPEYIDAIEIGHFYETRQTAINTNLFYRQVNGMISRITRLRDDGVTYTTFKNLNNSRSYGLELVVNHQIARWWRINTDMSYFHTELSGTGVNVSQANASSSWRARVNSMLRLSPTTDAQLGIFYFSPVVSSMAFGGGRGGYFMGGGGQGRTSARYAVNLGVKQELLKGKVVVFLRVSDLLKTKTDNQTTYGDNFETTTRRFRDSRVLFLGVSYKINEGIKEKDRKKRGEEDEYEMEEYQATP